MKENSLNQYFIVLRVLIGSLFLIQCYSFHIHIHFSFEVEKTKLDICLLSNDRWQ